MPDNNTAERAMRAIAIGRKNWLFAGSERGGRSAAIAYTLIETAKLNGVDPQAWLTDVLGRISPAPPPLDGRDMPRKFCAMIFGKRFGEPALSQIIGVSYARY
jgi:hypothetical protein